VDGAPLDERALLYDQAFALLGYAGAAGTLTASAIFEQRALELRAAIESRFRAPEGGFRADEAASGRRESNSHMHLLEACLTWAELGKDSGWTRWANELVDLALGRFIRQESGALGEFFDASWNPAPGTAGRLIEPGHQFEWAWLLLKSPWARAEPIKSAALRLIGVGERGIRNQVAVNSIFDDFSIHDPNARLWPQTERLKAALLAAKLTGEAQYQSIARAAAASLMPYLATPVAGLWFDVQLPSGELLETPAPASSFYHLVGATAALDEFRD
jgi:mannose-6-phosphate isomerase